MDKKSVLVVDDNHNQTRTMTYILRRNGYDVTTAKDGVEAIEIIKEKSFNLIFMDIKMPQLNGVETFKRLKKIRHEAAVIMMTAYSVDDLVEEALQEGARGIMYKPLDMEKVGAIIGES